MNNRAEVRINLKALAHNILHAKGDSKADFLAVVKANAYGHGLIPVAEVALSSGATWLGTALLEEAIELRTAGITAPIIAWLTPPGEDFKRAIELNIDLSVPSVSLLNEISSASQKLGKRARVHIEVDTGMTRGGLLDEWDQFLKLLPNAHVEVVGFWTHFARADEPLSDYTQIQVNSFEAKLIELQSAGISPQFIHYANSAASLLRIGANQNILRVGIAMYGLSPDLGFMGTSAGLGLKPVMSVAAKLHLVKKVPAGSPVGYGGTAITEKDTIFGVVPMGYADGIPRNATSATGVTHNGTRAPIIGRVSMDQFVVDLGPESTAQAGDEVMVISESGYNADDWAIASSTINYEIVTRIAARVPRISV
jgi:alanine racemase